ncbi:sodium/proton antiporter, NhaB family [Mariprofundus ferrinatatus]|uniref:Sodium/proton antiporter, NhaB family n=1 Tax=Mariprofundus ferrinatatus TaxID=1921087 RepID=A0A2K8L4N2_9PROT|nr:sodium/proton antiporter [Mariprofundus ferrinatatus]ATX82285.1 sodium/proton antiporter, NhaB family [Mariprofundus ferrinatatus]
MSSTNTASSPAYPTVSASLHLFLGRSPLWYKKLVLFCLALNVVLYFTAGPLITSWFILVEFIGTLAMALKCFPLQPGGLFAIQALALQLTDTHMVYEEVEHGLPVILLVIFMVAGVHFLRDVLFRVINHVLLGIQSRLIVNVTTLVVIAILSAFLDALTILAILIAIATSFYDVYELVVSKVGYHEDPDPNDNHIDELHRQDLDNFRAFLRGLLMHGAIGTAIGGVCTLVGEPENLVIGNEAGWDFVTFLAMVSPATIPTLLAGIATCLVVERFGWFNYGAELPVNVRQILADEDRKLRESTTPTQRLVMKFQAIVGLLMVVALSMHLAEIGLIGLGVIILATAITGVTDEHKIAEAFMPGLPFAALLVMFYVIVAMIQSQSMFNPIMHWVMSLDGSIQVFMVFITNGFLSAISDNVFVATIYMDQITLLLDQGLITRETFDAQSVAVVMGTGIPSMSTPNGQAAFLFLLTSALAPKIRLGYGRMVYMALPYFVVCTLVAGIIIFYST